MSILETILKAQGGAAVKQMSEQFGISEEQTTSAISQLLPALTQGMKRNVSKPEGLTSLLGALQNGNHQRYIEDASQITQNSAVEEGNGILGHLLGSKEVSRQVASRAAESSGVDSAVLKKMLPMVATMMMGSMGQQTQKAGMLSALTGVASTPNPQAGGMIGKLLDADDDGSMFDDVLNLLKKVS
ncbi:MAG: DUF937 domain-containing protein [Gammaproteobacteria bacterium]|nr:DUF937 domain-containing protein [Gammaproteobacteria bacterium]